MLSMVMFVNEGIQSGHVQNVMTRRVNGIQHHKHDGQSSQSIHHTNLSETQGNVRGMPNEMTQSLDENPFVHGIDGQKDQGLVVERHIAHGFARHRPRRQAFPLHGANEKKDEMIVKDQRASDEQSAQNPLPVRQFPWIEPMGVAMNKGQDSYYTGRIQKLTLDFLLSFSVHYYFLVIC